MGEDKDVDRQLSRDQFLRRAAWQAAPSSCRALASAANALTTSRPAPGVDWPVRRRRRQSMFAQYVGPTRRTSRSHVHHHESEPLGEAPRGLGARPLPPYVGWLEYFATSGLVQPWNKSSSRTSST